MPYGPQPQQVVVSTGHIFAETKRQKNEEKKNRQGKKTTLCRYEIYACAIYNTPNICNRNGFIQDKVICKIISVVVVAVVVWIYVICSILVLYFLACARTLDGRFVGRLNLHTGHLAFIINSKEVVHSARHFTCFCIGTMSWIGMLKRCEK